MNQNFKNGVEEVKAILEDLMMNNDVFMETTIAETKTRIGWMPSDSPELEDEELEAHPLYEKYYQTLTGVSYEMIINALVQSRR